MASSCPASLQAGTSNSGLDPGPGPAGPVPAWRPRCPHCWSPHGATWAHRRVSGWSVRWGWAQQGPQWGVGAPGRCCHPLTVARKVTAARTPSPGPVLGPSWIRVTGRGRAAAHPCDKGPCVLPLAPRAACGHGHSCRWPREPPGGLQPREGVHRAWSRSPTRAAGLPPVEAAGQLRGAGAGRAGDHVEEGRGSGSRAAGAAGRHPCYWLGHPGLWSVPSWKCPSSRGRWLSFSRLPRPGAGGQGRSQPLLGRSFPGGWSGAGGRLDGAAGGARGLRPGGGPGGV